MAVRDSPVRAERGFAPPALERLAPPPPPDLLGARIDARTQPGDVVLDLYGRGGWVARAALDRQRRAVSLESGPLFRLLAEVVLRPPDVRHLDAAFQALAASPRGKTGLREAIAEIYATRCATCGRSVVLDGLTWESSPDRGGDVPAEKHYRCPACREQQGGGETRHAAPDAADVAAARSDPDPGTRARLAERFPLPPEAGQLADQLLDLHTPRQLAGLAWILEQIEGDLRAEPIEAALRLSFLHAVLPASRLQIQPGRAATLRIAAGRVRRPAAATWRERNPWLAFEEGFRSVRGFAQDLEGAGLRPVQARLGDDLRSLRDDAATVVLATAGPSAVANLAGAGDDDGVPVAAPPIALLLGQAPIRPSQETLSLAYHGAAWALGRDAAAAVPIEPLLATSWRPPWSWHSAALRRELEGVAPIVAADGRAILFPDGAAPEALAAVVLGAVAAGFRLVEARLGEPGAEVAGFAEFAVPGAALPPGPRTRANLPLPAVAGGPGDPELVPGPGLFAAPERIDARRYSPSEAARTISDAAVELLRARGEPARTERLFGELLVALDRAGVLRRLTSAEAAGPTSGGTSGEAAGQSATASTEGPVERLVGLVRDELGRSGQRRIVEVGPDEWWLADREDRAAAALPLADRVEWAVYSLLSTAGPISETAFRERIAAMFAGHDEPEAALVRACLASYRDPSGPADLLVTREHLLRRSAEHGELLALLADAGHSLGMRVWLGRAEHGRTVDGRPLADRLDDGERDVHLPLVARGPVEDIEAVDCIWYVRNRATIMFEVEWTAMLGEPLVRRHGRIPSEERLVRFLVVPPERTELVRFKIDRSALVRRTLDEGNWHVLKSNHLRAWLAAERPSLADLEPYLGLDPPVERTGEQLPLFDG